MIETSKYLTLLVEAELKGKAQGFIHFDLDDVLADWKVYVGKRLATLGDIFNFNDPLGNIKKLNKLDPEERKVIMTQYYLMYPNTFGDLDITEGFPILKNLIEILLDKGIAVGILSAVGEYHPNPYFVIGDKKAWCRKYLGNEICDRIMFDFVTSSRDKLSFIDNGNTVLIDDYLKTINSWNVLGGIGLHYTCPKETVRTLITRLL